MLGPTPVYQSWVAFYHGLPSLVGGLEHEFYDFPSIGNVIIPTDFHIFQRGRYTTNQLFCDQKLSVLSPPLIHGGEFAKFEAPKNIPNSSTYINTINGSFWNRASPGHHWFPLGDRPILWMMWWNPDFFPDISSEKFKFLNITIWRFPKMGLLKLASQIAVRFSIETAMVTWGIPHFKKPPKAPILVSRLDNYQGAALSVMRDNCFLRLDIHKCSSTGGGFNWEMPVMMNFCLSSPWPFEFGGVEFQFEVDHHSHESFQLMGLKWA